MQSLDPSELLHARCAEAAALLQANQALRARATGLLVLSWMVVAVGAAVAIAAKRAPVMIVVAPTMLLLASAAFQQFGDVTVLGAARRRLERLVNAQLSASALIYETSVSQIRQRPPLVTSVRLLQAVSAATGMAAIVASTVITVEQGSVWVTIAYVAVTGAAALSAAWSHRDMLRSGDVADRILLDAVADESISNHQ